MLIFLKFKVLTAVRFKSQEYKVNKLKYCRNTVVLL